MGRTKTLASNTLVFGITNFSSKLLVFFMLPFYTAVLSKEEFGTADLLVTIVALLQPVLSLSISQGAMRYALDKSKDTKQVFSYGFNIILAGSLLIIISSPFLSKLSILNGYVFLFILLFITQNFQSFFSFFARGINKVRLIGVAGVVGSFVVVLSNILLLFVFHFGVDGYLWSMVISNLFAIAILFMGGKMHLYFTKNKNIALAKEITNYSLPLIPNSLSWWINHSANRLILNHFCGVADVGIYSAASKMPSIIDTFRGIFVQAWQLSTISEYDKVDSSAFFKTMYRAYNVLIIFLCGILLLLSQFIAKVLYSSDFYEAWIYTPFLLVGVVFASMIAYYSPFYLAHKKTKLLFYSTFAGAIVTILLNLLLVPIIGIMGAAITSLISNLLIYLWLHIDSKKFFDYKNSNYSYYISFFLLTVQASIISFLNQSPYGIISVILLIIILLVNLKDAVFFYKAILGIIENKKIKR